MSNAIAPLRAGGAIAGIVPQSIEEVFRLSQAVLLSGMAPKDLNSAEKITVAIMTGLELGLPPMFSLSKIAVINGRPTIWGDAIPALLWGRGFKIKEWVEGDVAHCEVTRPDGEKIERTFSVADARKANLLGKSGPWQQYQSRMLQMRARGFAARDGAADILGGLYLQEEMIDITPESEQPKRKSSSAAKKDGTDKIFEEMREAIKTAPNAEVLQHLKEETYKEQWDTLPMRWDELLNDEFEDKLGSFTPESGG